MSMKKRRVVPNLESAKIRVIREIWASGGQVVKTKVFETDNEREANEYEQQLIAQCNKQYLTNRTKGGGPEFSKRDPYARLKHHRHYYYSPAEAIEKLGVSLAVWHRLILAEVVHLCTVEGCRTPVLDRKDIDELAAKIQDGTYPIDAWEMAAPHVWKAKPSEKRSLWWDDEPLTQQAERQYPMSRLEMLREAASTALKVAQRASSEPCHLIGSHERETQQPEQSEPMWDVSIRAGQEQHTYMVKLQQNQFIISDVQQRSSEH